MGYKLSTSQVPIRYNQLGIDMMFHGGTFAPADPDGYGICYSHLNDTKREYIVISTASCVLVGWWK